MKTNNHIQTAIDYCADLSEVIKDYNKVRNFLVKAYAEISTKIEYLEKKKDEIAHTDLFL